MRHSTLWKKPAVTFEKSPNLKNRIVSSFHVSVKQRDLNLNKAVVWLGSSLAWFQKWCLCDPGFSVGLRWQINLTPDWISLIGLSGGSCLVWKIKLTGVQPNQMSSLASQRHYLGPLKSVAHFSVLTTLTVRARTRLWAHAGGGGGEYKITTSLTL